MSIRFEITDAAAGRIKTDKATRALIKSIRDYGKTAADRGDKAIKAGWDMLNDVATDLDIVQVIGGATTFETAKRPVWRFLQPFAAARKAEDGYEAAVGA